MLYNDFSFLFVRVYQLCGLDIIEMVIILKSFIFIMGNRMKSISENFIFILIYDLDISIEL